MGEPVRPLKKKLDVAFSKYVRLRDALVTTGTKTRAKCITCGKVLEIKSMDAGHWRSRGMQSTRYDEHNVAAQCRACNLFGNGKSEEFRRALVKMYGEDEVERIFQESNHTKQWKADELKELLKYYREEYELMYENN